MVMRAFDANATRSVRRATIVYSADDIRRNITLRLSDGLPCVLELGNDIPITSGFTLPGGLRAFSIDGAQRFKFLVLGSVPFLFYAQGASNDTGFPVEVRDVTIQLKAGATLTSCFVVEQVSYVSTSTFADAFTVQGVDINATAGTCTNVLAHGSFATALGFRIGRFYVDRLATNGVSNFLAVGDSNAFWQDCTARNVLMASTGAMTFGQGTASSVFSGVIENLSGNVDVSLGSRSVASIQYALITSFTGNSVSPTLGKVTLLRVATSGTRTLTAYDVDLDNLGGGGSPAIGGTITGGTAGSVLFVDPAATIAQDNANFFYDNANNRLGIGTAVPSSRLHLAGSTGVLVETVASPWAVFGADVAGSNYLTLRRPGTTSALGYIGGGNGGSISAGTDADLAVRSEQAFYIATLGNNPRVIVESGGNVGVGVMTPNELLTVNARLSLAETTAPAATVGFGKIYVKATDGDPYYMDGAGVETALLGGGGGAALTAAVITVPFGFQERTATVVDASATAASLIMVAWGNTANTDENQPPASNVTFSAVGAAGQVLITVSSNNRDNVGGTYKVLYILG